MNRLFFFVALLLLAACKSEAENDSRQNRVVSTSPQASVQDPELRESISRGAEIYNNFCASCHLSGGEGIPNVFPPLNQADWLTEKRRETIRAVKHGLQGPITVNGVEYDNLMPKLGLEDREVADVLNYIFQAWENDVEPPVTVEEVKAVTKELSN